MFPIAAIATVLSVVALVLAPFWGVLIVLALRPVIDTTWAYSSGAFSLLNIIGVAFPLLLLPRLLRGQERVGRKPLLAAVATALLVAYTFGRERIKPGPEALMIRTEMNTIWTRT